ncbi:MAG: patatin-like phospholipase family protein [Xanthobacteraceae bacterium]|nr:patatin-like phospholipase family protein [Xanthobacteraceae bacterium]
MKLRVGPFAVAALLLASGCSVHNIPVNEPINQANAGLVPQQQEPAISYADEFLITLAFSGGGTRAAAYSFGVLRGLDRFQLPTEQGTVSILDRIDFVSGVSGGSITAAYFGLKKRATLDDFRERFLLKNVEDAALSTSLTPGNLVRGLSGGVNDATHLPRWLNENLYGNATFAAFRAQQRPRVWINASDIYNRTPFVFGRTAFSVMCSDLNSYPIADAVAASAAVPIAFAPIVIESYAGKCNAQLPDWAIKARNNPQAPLLLKSFANALASYHDGSVRYVKLLDGGLVDNFGLSGFTIARLSASMPYEPLTPHQAVKLRRALFLVVDAGRAAVGNWVNTLEGPRGVDLVSAAADTAIDANVRASYTAFEQAMEEWRQQIVRWRCGLSAAQRAQYGAPKRWNCRDVQFFIGRIGFDQLGQQRADALNKVKTSLQLPADQVDEVINAGDESVTNNDVLRRFLSSIRR